MANHKNTKKAIRTNAKKRLLNRYQAVTSRNLVKKLRATSDHAVASDLLKTVISKLDRLAKKNIIHKNKAANNKSKLTRLVNKLAPATAA
ncbi:30S ribosomal protein S20 [uncultured Fibrella sp.]|uniref:30S ribosomal protein S20 n=1 Tax=uncultured Fibrella sp. TaxID=1284596 RepID=UPI0035CC8B93